MLVLVQFLQLTVPRPGDAVIVPVRNLLLLPDRLKILPQFLCCSDSHVNYIKLREASFSSAPVSGVWFWCIDQWMILLEAQESANRERQGHIRPRELARKIWWVFSL